MRDSFAPPVPLQKLVRKTWIDLFVAVALFGIIVGVVRPTLFSRGYPGGADTLSHLYTVWYLAEHWQQNGGLAQWNPYWFNGTPLTQYFAPLAYYLMLPLQLWSADPITVYRGFVVGCLFGAAFLTYLLFSPRLGRPAASFAGLLYVLSPYEFRMVFWEGDLPRALAVLLMPVALHFILRVVETGRGRDVVFLSAVISLMLLSQDSAAFAFILCFGLSLTLRSVIADRDRLDRVLLSIVALFLGVGLSSWWLIPSWTGTDLPDVPNFALIPEKAIQHSVDGSVFSLALRSVNLEAPYLGLLLTLSAVVEFLARRDRLSWIVGAAGGIALFMAFGVNNPLAAYLPLHENVLADRFLSIASLALALLSGRLIGKILALPRPVLGIPLSLLALGLALVDASPYWGLARPGDYHIATAVANSLSTETNPGRLVDQVGIPGTLFFPEVLDKRSGVNGWGLESTPHLEDLIAVNRAIKMGYPDFVLSTYALWNVRYVLLNDVDTGLVSRLRQSGFRQRLLVDDKVLLAWDRPSSYFIIQDRDVLTIGRGALEISMAFPWVAHGDSWYVDDYDPEYLSQFKTIFLYGYRYRNEARAEQLLRRLVDDGKRVIVDITDGASDYLFGVTGEVLELRGHNRLGRKDDAALFDGLDQQQVAVAAGGNPPSGAALVNLDSVMLTLTVDGFPYPAVGYKRVGNGRVYFAGFNFPALASQTHDPSLWTVTERLLEMADPNKSILPRALDVVTQRWQDDSVSFSYELDRPTPVIVSTTYSPRLSATVDGAAVKLYDFERLALLFLPAGGHSVQLAYSSSRVQTVGLEASLLSLAGTVLAAILLPSRVTAWTLWLRRRAAELLLGSEAE